MAPRDRAMKAVALLRFVLELAAVVALALAGAEWSWIAAVAAPVVFVVVWGALVAPKARHRLADPLRLAVEIVLFAIVGGTLALAGHVAYGVVIATSSAVVAVALRVGGDPWADEPARPRDHGVGQRESSIARRSSTSRRSSRSSGGWSTGNRSVPRDQS